jgi:hypothetical protein
VQSIADAERIYGVTVASISVTGAPAFNKSLTRGIYEAYQAGATSITLCRVGGTSATATLVDSATATNNLLLSGNYPGGKYNALTYAVNAPASTASAATGSVVITTLDAIAHTFVYANSTLYGDLINQINAAQLNIQAGQGLQGNQLAAVKLSTVASTPFSGGTDGTNVTDAQYSDALSAAYAQLEQFPADVIVPLGAYLQPTFGLDNNGNPTVANPNTGDTVFFGQNLAQFVARLSVRTHSAIGVITTAPLAVPTFTNSVRWMNQLEDTAYTFQYQGPTVSFPQGYVPSGGPLLGAALGSDGKFVDIGYLLNIVVGPDVILNNPQVGNYQIDAGATYAGQIVSLPAQSATTNKPLPTVLALAYSMGASVQDTLTGARFVCLANQFGAIRTVADQTYSLPARDFTKLSTLRVTYAAMESVRHATQQFIGEAANPANLNAMGTAVKGALTAMKSAGALIDFSYAINASAQDQINGNLRITLGLVPALQIRKIFVTITLKPAASF